MSQIAIGWVEWNVIQFQLYAIKALLAISLPYDSIRYEMLISPRTFAMPHLRSSTDNRCINFFNRCTNVELLSDPSNSLCAVSKSSAFASNMSSVKCHSSIQQCGYYFFTKKYYIWVLPLKKKAFSPPWRKITPIRDSGEGGGRKKICYWMKIWGGK